MGRSTSKLQVQEYTEQFPAYVVGGRVVNWTVPAGVSQIEISAVAPGGNLAGQAYTMGMSSGSCGNVVFARTDGTNPPVLVHQASLSAHFGLQMSGQFVYASVQNANQAGIFGTSPYNASILATKFNPYDTTPWGVCIGTDSGTAAYIASTVDGLNFRFSNQLSTSADPGYYGICFGSNGECMVSLGSNTGATQGVWYTNDYGNTWTQLISAFGANVVYRIRYLNGTWFAILNLTTFKYITTPLVSGVVQTWTTSTVQSLSIYDIAWTGTTYVAACSDATNVKISSTITGSWSSQAHGCNLTVNNCESSPYVGGATCSFATNVMTCVTAPTSGSFAIGQVITSAGVTSGTRITALGTGTGGVGTYTLSTTPGTITTQACTAGGEVVVFNMGNNLSAASSVRATDGAATTYASVDVYSGQGASSLRYEAVKWLPFTSGGMWIFGGGSTTKVTTTTSAVYSSSCTAATINGVSTGWSGTASTLQSTVQWTGGNYCSLGTTNGMSKYSSAGVITTSISSNTALSTEFGYKTTVNRAPSVTIKKNGTTIISLQGGGTSGINGTGAGGSGGGGSNAGPTTVGQGPGGAGSSSTTAAPFGNGGFCTVANSYGGGGGGALSLSIGSQYRPAYEGARVPGASGGYQNSASVSSGGGGSLFAAAGNGTAVGGYNDPLLIYNASSRVGNYGAGAGGAQVLTTTYKGGAGGGEGIYKYPLAVTPGDVIQLTLPGISYIYAVGTTGTDGGPGGEAYAEISYIK